MTTNQIIVVMWQIHDSKVLRVTHQRCAFFWGSLKSTKQHKSEYTQIVLNKLIISVYLRLESCWHVWSYATAMKLMCRSSDH